MPQFTNAFEHIKATQVNYQDFCEIFKKYSWKHLLNKDT